MIILTFLVFPVFGQSGPAWRENLDTFLDAYQRNSFPFNGAFLVCSGDSILYQRLQGYANFELGSVVKADTRFRVGSVSKQFAGFLAWQLVEEGKLDLEAPVARYVPRLEGSPAGRVNMHQLLSHSAGLPPNKYIWEYAELQEKTPFSFEGFFDQIARDTFHFEPGSKYEYCNTCYVMAAGVLERISGKTYSGLLREKILAPLGMNETGLDSLASLLPGRAYNYEREFEQGLRPAMPIDLAPVSAAAGMYSTVSDLYRWVRMLFFTEDMLSPETRQRFFTPSLNGYAYGLMVRDKTLDRNGFQVPVIEHDGFLEGTRAYITYLPEKDIALVILSNFGRSFPFFHFQREIIKILYDRPFQKPKRCLAYHFACDLRSKGIDYAVAEFQRRLPDETDYFLSQSKLNEYGYYLLRRGRLEEAIAAFQLNAAAFPDSWNAHVSLAEAYQKAGAEELAITHYERSLSLNPGNGMCRKKLKELLGKKED